MLGRQEIQGFTQETLLEVILIALFYCPFVVTSLRYSTRTTPRRTMYGAKRKREDGRGLSFIL